MSTLEILQDANAGGNLATLNKVHKKCRQLCIPKIPSANQDEKRARFASLSTSRQETLNLNISSKYCAQNPAWNVHAGLRELIQNWRDQIVKTIGDSWKVEVTSTDQSNCYVAYQPNDDDPSKKLIGGFILECFETKPEDAMSSIYLVNYGTELPDSALTIGLSTKVGSTNMVGSHGEGMKVGINRLLAKGVHVGVLTRGQDWRFTHENESLHLIRRESSASSWDPNFPFYPLADATTCFVVQGFPARMKVEDYLFLGFPEISSDPDTYVVKYASIEAQIFLGEHIRKVFVKGIFVEEKDELEFQSGGGLGINIVQGLPLDRDRCTVKLERIAFAILQLFQDIQKMLRPDRKAMKGRRQLHARDEKATAKARNFVSVLYKELENYEVGYSSIIPNLLENMHSNPVFSQCIYEHFLREHDVDPVEDKKSTVPLVLPVTEHMVDEDIQEYQYFLGLPVDKIVKCREALLKVLRAHKQPKTIEEYMVMFWDKVTSLPDYDIKRKRPEFLKWVEVQMENTFKGILEMDLFHFKTLPSDGAQLNMNASTVRAIRTPHGTVRGVIVDCEKLFSSCTCATPSTTCAEKCVKATFLTSLKSSLFRNNEYLRQKHEEQMQDYMIRLTTPAANDEGDGEMEEEEEEEEAGVEIDLSRFFFMLAIPLPSQIMSIITHGNATDCGCRAISLNSVMTFRGMSIYIDPELVSSNSALFSPMEIQRVYKQELESCVQNVETIFTKIGKQALLSHCGVFLSNSTHLHAFNRGGQLFFNALSVKATSLLYELDLDRLLSFWFVVVCHQAAHNLYANHGKAHGQAMERLMSHLIPLVWRSENSAPRNSKIQHFYKCVVLNSSD